MLASNALLVLTLALLALLLQSNLTDLNDRGFSASVIFLPFTSADGCGRIIARGMVIQWLVEIVGTIMDRPLGRNVSDPSCAFDHRSVTGDKWQVVRIPIVIEWA